MKKVIMAIIVILLIACASVFAYSKFNEPVCVHDGITGVISFKRLSKNPIGYGVEFLAEEVPFNIELTNGTLKLEVLRNGNIIFESEFNSSESTTVNIPEAGMYLIQISGKKAEGTIKYEVSDIKETNVTADEVISLADNTKISKAKEAVLKYLNKIFVEDAEDVEDIKIIDFKLYTEKEMEESEVLKEALEEGKLAFDVGYEIILKDGADGMKYTAATGQVDGNVVKDKFNVGYLTEKNGNFEVDNSSFGTGF